MTKTFITAMLLLGFYVQAIAQQDQPPGSIPLTDIEKRTNAAMKEQAAIYNGRDYIFFPPQIEGSGYFENKEWEQGIVVYDGQRYENIPLMYDIVRDLLVSRLTDGRTSYSLINEKVSAFSLLGRQFVRFNDESKEGQKLAPGFYEQLHNGKALGLAKHIKILETAQTREEVRQYFRSKTNYYLYKDGKYHSINSEGAFLALFKAEKASMKRRLKDAKVSYKKDPAKAISLLLAYYDGLNN